jgi:hypothetical protein
MTGFHQTIRTWLSPARTWKVHFARLEAICYPFHVFPRKRFDAQLIWKHVAAPAETRTPNWHRANQSLNQECGWKRGDSWQLGGNRKRCLTKKQMNLRHSYNYNCRQPCSGWMKFI